MMAYDIMAELERSERLPSVDLESDKNFDNISTTQNKGRHAVLLEQALDKTVKKCLSVARFSLFAHNYKSLYEKKPKELHQMHQHFLQQLNSNIKAELQQMFEEENILPLMNNLDQLITQAPPTQPVWRPSNIEGDLRTHIMVVKLNEKERLQGMLEGLQKKNQHLLQIVEKRRKNLVETVDRVKNFENVMAQILDCDTDDQTIDYMDSL